MKHIPLFAIVLVALFAVTSTASAAAPSTHNVLAYGASAASGNDDTAAIQRALDAAQPGDSVYLPAGHYGISRSLSVPEGVILVGAGQQTAVLKALQNQTAVVSMGRDSILRGLTVEGTNVRAAAKDQPAACLDKPNGVYVQFDNVLVERVTVTRHGCMGIHVNGGRNFVVRDSTLSGNWNSGMLISYGADNALVDNVQANNNWTNGVDINASNVKVRNSVFSGNGGACRAYKHHSDCNGVNVFTRDKDHPLSGTRVENNWIENNSLSGVRVSGKGSPKDTRIVDNTLRGNDESGVGIYGSYDTRVERNVIEHNGYGIYLTGKWKRVVIKDNAFARNAKDRN